MPDRPNILIITTHDSGRHFGCYGVPTVQTPAIDQLATEGVLFGQMHAGSPICSPSRGCLLTGRYPQSNGLVGLAGGSWNWELIDYQQHLSHRLRREGFHTAQIGMHHETVDLDNLGFDAILGDRLDAAPDVADHAAAFLHDHRDDEQPFYAQVGFFETHTPYEHGGCQPDDDLGAWVPPYAQSHDWPGWYQHTDRLKDGTDLGRQHVAALQGALRQLDNAVKVILDTLRETGLEEQTLVLFNTDHGPELPGAKWTMYDAGTGIAFILRWPGGGVAGGRRCDWLLHNIDFLLTLYELIGLPVPEDAQGVSFAAACREETSEPSPRDTVFCNWVDGLNFSARTDRYKLIRNLVPIDSTGRKCPEYELYDLNLDPVELSNVAHEPAYASVLEDMTDRLDSWLDNVDDPLAHDDLPKQPHNAMIADYRERYERSRGIR